MARTRSARRSPKTPHIWKRSAPSSRPQDIPAEAELAYGEPANEIVKWVQQKGCDLVAMSTHGHRLLADLFLGTTATRVRHSIGVPILLLRAK